MVAVDGEPVEGFGALQRLMGDERIGREVTLTVVRGGAVATVTVRPVELGSGATA